MEFKTKLGQRGKIKTNVIQVFKKYLDQSVLSILVYKGGFSFLAYANGNVKHSGNRKIDVPNKDFGEKMIEQFQQMPISKWDTKFIELSFLNDEFTFVPKEDFSTDTAQNYLEIQSPIDPFASIRFNPIEQKECVVCFNYNEEIEFFFENHYPFVNIIHNSNRILSKLKSMDKNIIQLIFHEQFFEIAVVGNKLDYYNCKPYSSSWDVVYAVKHYLMGNPVNYKIQIFGKPNFRSLKGDLEKNTGLQVVKVKNSEFYPLISN